MKENLIINQAFYTTIMHYIRALVEIWQIW